MVLTDAETKEPSQASLEEQAMEAHVQSVLQSPFFQRAETLRKLLLYLWAHRGEEISEYAVAIEALGRRSDFDPKTDASVRVQISRLRRKLKDVDETEGSSVTYVLHIPIGTHALTIIESGSSPALRVAPQDQVAASSGRRGAVWLIPVLSALCVLLLIVTSLLGWELRKARSTSYALIAPTRFWTRFMGAGSPVKIILPTPVFFSFPDGAPNLHVRDVSVNEFQSWPSSPTLATLASTTGSPQLDHAYTVTSDTLAAIELAKYLDRAGLAERVEFGVSGDATMNLLETSSVIALGAHATLHPFRDYLASMNFSLATGEVSVLNARPTLDEQASYDLKKESIGRQLEPSIVAVLPGRNPGRKLLILQSRHTSALVSLLTSQVGDTLLEKMYREHGSPAYFEAVVMNESEGDHIIRSYPVAMHAYTQKAPDGVM